MTHSHLHPSIDTASGAADAQPDDLAEALSIRDFAREYDYDEALIRRVMRELAVRGISQGRGRPTLLSVDDQDRLLDHIEGPEEESEDPEEPLEEAAAEAAATQETIEAAEFYESEAYASQDYSSQENETSQEGYEADVYETEGYEAEADIAQDYDADNADHQHAETQNTDEAHEEKALGQVQTSSTRSQPRLAAVEVKAQTKFQADEQPRPQRNPAPLPQQNSMTSQPHDLARYDDRSSTPSDRHDSGHSFDPHTAQTSGNAGDRAPASDYATHYPTPYRRENLEITPGNHRLTVETPEIPRAYDLGQFRSEEAVATIAEPAEVVGQAIAAIDSLVAGMDADIRQQRNQLAQTQEAARALRIKAKQLHKKQIEYMIQSSAIGQAQQRCTTDLQEALGEVQALGKSPRNEPEPPSS